MKYSALPFPCIDGWTQPSADNEFLSCTDNQINDWVWDHFQVWGAAIPAVLGVLILIPLSCLVLGARYCCHCCGSSKMTPSSFCGDCCCYDTDTKKSKNELHRKYSGCGVFVVKLFSIALIFAAISGVVLSHWGGVEMKRGLDHVMPTLDGLQLWADGLIEDAKRGIANPDNSSDFPAGFNIHDFDAITDRINGYHSDAKQWFDDNDDGIRIGSQVLAYVSIVPGVVLALPLFAALCNIRRVLPLTFILFSFFFQCVYLCFGTICIALVITFSIVHTDISTPLEVTNSNAVPPRSVTEWYLIPKCEEELSFQAMIDNVAEIERTAAIAACQALLDVCSDSEVYDFANAPDAIFYCNLTAAAVGTNGVCETMSSVNEIVDGTHVKTDPALPQAEACGASIANEYCTLRVCGENCTRESVRSEASESIAQLDTATRAVNTYETILRPWMSCQALARKALESGVLATLDKFLSASRHLRTGALIIGCGLVGAIFFGLLGQKRYLSSAERSTKSADENESLFTYVAQTPHYGSDNISYSPATASNKVVNGVHDEAPPTMGKECYIQFS